MLNKKQKGNFGETLAFNYLNKKGFEIIGRNVQCGRSEIDIIAQSNNTLIFIEVKTRRTGFFGNPEDFVDLKKQRSIVRGAQWYIEKMNYQGEIRFDIVAIIHNESQTNIEHFEDAFWLRE